MKRLIVVLSTIGLIFSVTSCNKNHFEKSIYSEQPEIGLYQDYLAKNPDLPTEGTGPILATGSEKSIIKKSGLEFKDSNGNKKLDLYEDWRLTPTERATDLVSQMSVAERLGLLNWLGESGNTEMTKNEAEDILYYGIEGINADGTYDDTSSSIPFSLLTNGLRYVNDNMEIAPMDEVKYNNNIQGLVERSKWGIPMIISSDPAHNGWAGDDISPTGLSKWPYYIGLGAADDLKTTKIFGETVAAEMRMAGHQMLLGPQADIATDPRWARISQVIHSNGDLTAKHIKVLIQAMQGGSELKPWGMATTVKHIPGSGSVEEGMDSHTEAGKYSLFPGNNLEEHLKPFIAAVEAGAAATMACYSIIDVEEYKDIVNGKPIDEGAAFSTKIMTDLLKTRIGFKGAVLSDWGIGTSSPWGHENIKEKPEILAEMLNAGTYQYGGKDFTELWKEAFEFGLISEDVINTAATRALELQFKLGLFENPYINLDIAEKFWDPNGPLYKERNDAAESAMKKAMTLVKSIDVAENSPILPINGTDETYINAVDLNGNGKVDVYFDSAYPNADSGQGKSKAVSTDSQYLNINFVDNIKDADVAITRIFSRGATYFGTTGATPLNYDDPVYVYDRENKTYTDELVKVTTNPGEAYGNFGPWVFDDWSNLTGSGMIGQGYMTYLGYSDSKAALERALKAKAGNPDLKVIIGMTDSRPGIISGFLDDIDGMIIDFAATDKAFLDVVFFQGGNKPEGRLPFEIPSTWESLSQQLGDVPNDTPNPTFETGYGLNYPSIGGYGG
ncbi:glycoside hydrolase family 3 protein [Thiospirochaeta perfilievii]|uniref:beta-glucosidase n=1 Tax=Thiospirochaeta perfilievii TaxID=252967 RepID=A0A5C1QDY0_9SPIO|nr:glycoside hydrolase family 3 N-terminal domain-containing protein [Thiospirochaeta perfilievii]QEN05280.1 glycoside hydrolase family 3 protein [Thiospirochaeta perfilievii]